MVARQQSGLRLEQAIAAVRALQQLDEPSVFAAVRNADPRLPRQRLRKSTLIALSWAIEDEMCAHGIQGFAFGAFQRGRFYEPAASRWRDLAAALGSGWCSRSSRRGPPSSLAAPALSAWERPGQEAVLDGEREYEVVWTLDPVPVRAAGHVCLDIAEASGAVDDVASLRTALAASPLAAPPSPQAVTEFCDRVIGQFDERGRAERGSGAP